MCGRFTSEIPPELLIELFGLLEPPTLPPRYNIAPTQMVPVIRQCAGRRNRLDLLHWGLIPPWAKGRSGSSKMINARSETVTEKAAFRQAVKYRRCLVLASGFYEWVQAGRAKRPAYVRLKDGSPMLLAGLWESWSSPEGEQVESCAILTTAANSLVEPIHGRMPVILHRDQCRSWLDREVHDPAHLAHLFQPYPADRMEMWHVSPLVNNVRNESAHLIEPVEEMSLFNWDGPAT